MFLFLFSFNPLVLSNHFSSKKATNVCDVKANSGQLNFLLTQSNLPRDEEINSIAKNLTTVIRDLIEDYFVNQTKVQFQNLLRLLDKQIFK